MIGSLTNPVYAYLTSSEVFILYETRCPCHSSTFQTDDVECHPLYDSKAYFLSFQQFILKNLFFISHQELLEIAVSPVQVSRIILSDSGAYTREAMHRTCSNLATLLCQFFPVHLM